MKLFLLTIGKTKSKPIQTLVADYAKRLHHYIPLTMTVVRNENTALEVIDKGDYLIACDERGLHKTSREFAIFIARHQDKGSKRLVFFIGGPDGFGEELRNRADMLLSLSSFTLPHELSQVILLEQLYRACTIVKGEPYHR